MKAHNDNELQNLIESLALESLVVLFVSGALQGNMSTCFEAYWNRNRVDPPSISKTFFLSTEKP